MQHDKTRGLGGLHCSVQKWKGRSLLHIYFAVADFHNIYDSDEASFLSTLALPTVSCANHKAANTRGEKSDALRKYEEHLWVVGVEWSHYSTRSKTEKSDTKQYFASHPDENIPAAACSRDLLVAYSFHTAQQLHYPSDLASRTHLFPNA